MAKKKYFSLEVADRRAQLNIYGDITSWVYEDSDVTSYTLSKALDEMGDVDEIDVNINSYGGEVAEGLAIYNALRRHTAHIVTHNDGFACSIASVIFMAGDERIMSDSSLLMIHNAWTLASGNAEDLRKQADDLETITEASKAAYLSRVEIDEDKLADLMDNETWITPADALDMGFATDIEKFDGENVSQNARRVVFEKMTATDEVVGEHTTCQTLASSLEEMLKPISSVEYSGTVLTHDGEPIKMLELDTDGAIKIAPPATTQERTY